MARTNNPKLRKSQDGCCSCKKSTLKTNMIFYCCVLLIAAIAAIFFGVYYLLQRDAFVPILSGQIIFLTHFLMLSSGCLLCLVAIIGFITTKNEQPNGLSVFIAFLFFCLLMKLLAGLLGYFWLPHFMQLEEERIAEDLRKHYRQSAQFDKFSKSFDKIQTAFRCCGSVDYRDWLNSAHSQSLLALMRRRGGVVASQSGQPRGDVIGTDNQAAGSGISARLIVPSSCCKSPAEFCGENTHPSNIHYDGCTQKIFAKTVDILKFISPIALGLIFFEILGICFAFMLKNRILRSQILDSQYTLSNYDSVDNLM